MNGSRSIVPYLRRLLGIAPGKLTVAVGSMLAVTALDWSGLLMLVPLLGLAGVDVGEGSVGLVSERIGGLMASLGVSLDLLTVLTIYVALVSAHSLLSRWQAIAVVEFENSFAVDLRLRLYRAIVGARWLHLSRLRASDLLHALTDQSERAAHASKAVLSILASVFTGSVYLLLALQLSPPMTVLACLSGVLLVWLLRRGNRSARQAGDRLNAAIGSLFTAGTEHLGSLKTTKSYGAEERSTAIFQDASVRVGDAGLQTVRSFATVRVWFGIGSVVLLASILFVALEVLELATAEVLLLLFIFTRLVPRFSAVQQNGQFIANALPAFVRIMELQSACETQAESGDGGGERLPDLRSGIALRGVSFGYGRDGDSQVRDLDLFVPARRITAIVGPSGAGKSTVADLVMGLLSPARGELTLDGRPLSETGLRGWRRQIGYVQQETFLFHDTIRANLLWADPQATEDDLWEALRLSSASEFVTALPDGLDTAVGDRGVLVSGGERQRLALARALVRRPSLLILDESTSALDSENENQIQEAIGKLAGRVTVLIIAHRLSSIRCADLIHVMERGRLIESGSWSDLLERGGRFAGLCRAQQISVAAPLDGLLEPAAT